MAVPDEAEEQVSEASTLSAIIEEFASGGFAGDFGVGDDPVVRCHACQTDSPPTEVTVASSRRVEGASDPADMSTVYGVRCPACGEQGALVLRYGPEASAAEAEVARTLRDRRHGDEGYTTPVEAGAAPVPARPEDLDPGAPPS